MKKQENEVRKKMVVVRMNDKEFEQVEKLRKKSTQRSLSSYVRQVVLQKPVTVKYRNESVDDFLEDMLELKRKITAIGNNFNQAVHRLHILDEIPEFRLWITLNDGLQRNLVKKVEEIRLRMNQLYDEWMKNE